MRTALLLILAVMIAGCNPVGPEPGGDIRTPWPSVQDDARLGGVTSDVLDQWNDVIYGDDVRELPDLRDRDWAQIRIKALEGIEHRPEHEQDVRRDYVDDLDAALSEL